MPAYVILDVEIEDPVAYEEYKKLTPATVAAYDGRFIARGGATATLEGDWQPGRIAILEFPNVEQAQRWWASGEYAPAKDLRQKSTKTKMIVVEGV
jgi:uncharacterized protein (DUF1330 family)